MIGLRGGVLQASLDVSGFKVGIVGEDFGLRHVGSEQIEHVFDANAHPPDARPSAALRRVVSDPVKVIHWHVIYRWNAREAIANPTTAGTDL